MDKLARVSGDESPRDLDNGARGDQFDDRPAREAMSASGRVGACYSGEEEMYFSKFSTLWVVPTL